jgi:hypothetical protein
VANKVLTLSTVGLFSYAARKRRIALADLGDFNAPGALSGDVMLGRVMLLIIRLPLVGQNPDLRKANLIFSSINALSYTLLNIGQKKLFDIETCPAPLSINWLSSSE